MLLCLPWRSDTSDGCMVMILRSVCNPTESVGGDFGAGESPESHQSSTSSADDARWGFCDSEAATALGRHSGLASVSKQ